jgi:hypothetical protein
MRIIVLSLALGLCACRKDAPPTPTAEQSSQLNETDDMLNSLAANEKGPADRRTHQSTTLTGPSSTGPSNSD